MVLFAFVCFVVMVCCLGCLVRFVWGFDVLVCLMLRFDCLSDVGI